MFEAIPERRGARRARKLVRAGQMVMFRSAVQKQQEPKSLADLVVCDVGGLERAGRRGELGRKVGEQVRAEALPVDPHLVVDPREADGPSREPQIDPVGDPGRELVELEAVTFLSGGAGGGERLDQEAKLQRTGADGAGERLGPFALVGDGLVDDVRVVVPHEGTVTTSASRSTSAAKGGG